MPVRFSVCVSVWAVTQAQAHGQAQAACAPRAVCRVPCVACHVPCAPCAVPHVPPLTRACVPMSDRRAALADAFGVSDPDHHVAYWDRTRNVTFSHTLLQVRPAHLPTHTSYACLQLMRPAVMHFYG